jgi:hypothetical protein
MAKMDNTEHDEGSIHIDRYYREVGAKVKNFDADVDDCWDAENFLCENAQRFGRTYLRNHGKEPRTDGVNT